ncbi:MAG: class I tRNA ligase family protein, partial [Acidimicrobiia bacterium]|nr:class I tRNA ligase family protein [Acidimicrobiia bacterium]
MQVYNTLTRTHEPLLPQADGKVGLYLCGPTVQSEPHMGHGRSSVAFDVLWRYLEWLGNDVVFVRNVTDVDDKIIARATETGRTTDEVAAEAFEAFTAGYTGLGNRPPTVEPRATEHIAQMVALIEELIKRGHAYAVDGDVYFSVASFPDYGKLSGNSVEDLVAGNRIEPGDKKRAPAD